MNCTQAQILIAAYREHKQGDPQTIELDRHLEGCAACRGMLARTNMVSEQMRSLPIIEPPAELHTRLMQRLAAEHAKFMQQSASGTPAAPAFLKPYLQEHAQHTHQIDTLAALSTAETGPLPIIRALPRHRRRRPVMNQYAVIGLVASFLILIMMGGLTSLLFLTKGNPQVATRSDSVAPPTSIIKETYTTPTSFVHVVSAIGTQNAIYYSAYNDLSQPQWMLMQLNRTTRISTPLLAQAGASKIVILSGDAQHIVWLQLDQEKSLKDKNPFGPEKVQATQPWSLHEMTLSQTTSSLSNPQKITESTLYSSTFTQDQLPGWIHNPVQGITMTAKKLLVSVVDSKGISHLNEYRLDASNPTGTLREIAAGKHDHVLTSPTSMADGSQIFWSDEWESSDGTLNSNIWTEQTHVAQPQAPGRWSTHMTTEKSEFLANTSAFRPTVVGNTLFWISTIDLSSTSQGATPTATPTRTPTPTSTPGQLIPSSVDSSIYQAPADQMVRGSLVMFTLNGDPNAAITTISTRGQAMNLQGGSTFILCRTDTDYEMFDSSGTPYNVGSDLDQALFISVNRTTTVWTDQVKVDANVTPTPQVPAGVTLSEYTWPPIAPTR